MVEFIHSFLSHSTQQGCKVCSALCSHVPLGLSCVFLSLLNTVRKDLWSHQGVWLGSGKLQDSPIFRDGPKCRVEMALSCLWGRLDLDPKLLGLEVNAPEL